MLLNAMATGIGVVVIGRNEGPRLQRCLASVLGMAQQIVYVDSGSTDGSVQMARGLGVEVVELDMAIPFTAARALTRIRLCATFIAASALCAVRRW